MSTMEDPDFSANEEMMQPKDASILGQDEIHHEMARYGLQPSAHHANNVQLLQEKYDDEFQKTQAGRNEYLEKRRKADAARRKRAMYEAQHVEEMEALARDPKLEVWYNLAQENQTPQNACLRHLNAITCRAVARILQQNSSLLSLDVSRSNLGDEAGSHLAEMLRTNRRLLKLEAENNNFGPLVARAFGQALKVNNTLSFLSLENNSLTRSASDGRETYNDFSGVDEMSSMLEVNTSLTSLNLFSTGLSFEGGKAIARGLLKNSSLIVLDVGNNQGIGSKELEAITDKLDKNKEQRELSDRIRREQRKESQRVAEERRKQHEAERKAKEEEEWHNEQARLREEKRVKERVEHRQKLQEEEEQRKKEEEEKRIEQEKKMAEAEAKKKKKKGKKKK